MRALERIASVLMVAALLWAATSYIEVCTKNLSGIDGSEPHYSEYNLYMLLYDWRIDNEQ